MLGTFNTSSPEPLASSCWLSPKSWFWSTLCSWVRAHINPIHSLYHLLPRSFVVGIYYMSPKNLDPSIHCAYGWGLTQSLLFLFSIFFTGRLLVVSIICLRKTLILVYTALMGEGSHKAYSCIIPNVVLVICCWFLCLACKIMILIHIVLMGDDLHKSWSTGICSGLLCIFSHILPYVCGLLPVIVTDCLPFCWLSSVWRVTSSQPRHLTSECT